jgi:1,4-dihydroxy-2-naphthoate octaprenyltransferase
MTFKQFSGIVELRTKIVSVSTYTVSLLYALWLRGSISPVRALLVFFAALAVDMGTTGFNSYFDWYRNVDDPKFNREEAKVLVHEGLSPGAAFWVSLSCFAVAALLGLVLTVLVGPWVLALGTLSLLVGFLYSGGPRPISSTPWGELFSGGFLGAVFFFINVYILTGIMTGSALLVSLPQSFAIAAILAVNNASDMEGDRAAGRRTLALAVGKAQAPWVVYGLVTLALGTLVFLSLWGLLPWPLGWTGTLSGIPIFMELRRLHRRGYDHDTKVPNMGSISKIFLVFSAAEAIGLAFALMIQ